MTIINGFMTAALMMERRAYADLTDFTTSCFFFALRTKSVRGIKKKEKYI